MTIRSNINARDLNTDLGNLESCAEHAPEGTYQIAKDTVAAIGECAETILATVRALGLKATGDDRLREIEAVIFGYIVANNEDVLTSAIGFGEHVHGPAGRRIIDQAARNRDAFHAAHARAAL